MIDLPGRALGLRLCLQLAEISLCCQGDAGGVGIRYDKNKNKYE